MQQKELDYVLERLKELLSIDSPTGFTEKAAEYVREQLKRIQYPLCALQRAGCWPTCALLQKSRRRAARCW